MNITELPLELISLIFQELDDIKDLYTCMLTCKLFYEVANLDEVWQNRIRREFNLLNYVSSRSPIFRRRQFKSLFRALRNPEVFVWGSTQNGRAGIPYVEKFRVAPNDDLYSPYWLKSLSKKGISSIVCGGYFMMALTHDHNVYFWGTFNGSCYEKPYSICQYTPILLNVFPNDKKIELIEAGRTHSLALTQDGIIFQIDNAILPAYNVQFENISTQILDIKCGFRSGVALTKDYRIIYWPFEYSLYPIYYNELVFDNLEKDEEFYKIAAGDNFVIGLTNKGKTIYWKVEGLLGSQETQSRPDNELYLKKGDSILGKALQNLQHKTIRHITAQFESFGAFSESNELIIGKIALEHPDVDLENLESELVSELEIKLEKVDIPEGHPIHISFGDWHKAVLLEEGSIYTWGEHALGHGTHTGLELAASMHPKGIETPTKVEFFNDDYFVFYLSCAGWHTAALAVDLRDSPRDNHYGFLPRQKISELDYSRLRWGRHQAVEIEGDFHPFDE